MTENQQNQAPTDATQAANAVQTQIQAGEDPNQAVGKVLGGANAGGGEGRPLTEMANQAMQAADRTFTQATQANQNKQTEGTTAQNMGQQLMEAARGAAMEVGEALFGGAKDKQKQNQKEKEKI